MEQTQVIICGGGPTGVLLSSLLSKAEVPNVVLEREADITTDPRGIALDEDGIRILQAIGVYDRIFPEIATTMKQFFFISGIHSDLYKKPLLAIDNSTSEGGTGHVGFICHKQPAMEKAIRDSIQNSPYSQFKASCTVTGVSENEHGVSVEYTNANRQSLSIQGKFLIGADGKTGFVRKKFLEPKGITMDTCEGTNYDETWIALNWKISLPTEKTHPDFPLWDLGLTPSEVYDQFFPKEFRFLCNPQRPAVCGRFGLESDRLWRFEFVVQKGEDPLEMATHTKTRQIIMPYLTHAGSRYGLNRSVSYPEDCIEVLRSRPFSFQARSCNKWALGRVALAGDASKCFPPFGGQGIASGFRDASALAWRLALLHRMPAANYEKVLESYYLERKQQVERSLAATVRNGEYVTESNLLRVFVRDWSLWLLQLIPSWKRELEKGSRTNGMTRYKHLDGLPFRPDGNGGLLLPQVYAKDLKSVRVLFSDDLIFAAGKKGLFQLLLVTNTQEEALSLLAGALDLPRSQWFDTKETTVLVHDCDPEMELDYRLSELGLTVARTATGEEFAVDSLCWGRPEPKYYDPHQISKEVKWTKYVIVRPDCFVYAACNTLDELREIINALPRVLSAQGEERHVG